MDTDRPSPNAQRPSRGLPRLLVAVVICMAIESATGITVFCGNSFRYLAVAARLGKYEAALATGIAIHGVELVTPLFDALIRCRSFQLFFLIL
jgi:hypothetical protein